VLLVSRASIKGLETVYKPVQLKQLPSHPVNNEVTLQAIIGKIKKKYPRSPDLTVCIWINRDTDLDLSQLNFQGLNIAQLWFTGDSQTGETTLEGGPVRDLISGFKWSGIIRNGKAQIPEQVRFRPCQPDGKE